MNSLRRTMTLAAALFLLSCPLTKSPVLPPGPDDPIANLAQYDAFADRVQREGLTAAWRVATEEHSDARPAPFGVMPMLLLEDAEVVALNARLTTPAQSRCLEAIHSTALRMQSESDPRVADALSRIGALRAQRPDLVARFTTESDVALRKELWLSQAPLAKALEPLVRQVVAARTHWARQRAHSGYLELMRQHRGYDPQVVARLENDVRARLRELHTPNIQPWEFELIDPALAVRMEERFDRAHCLERATFVLDFLGVPSHSPTLRVSNAADRSFSSFAFYPIDPPDDQRLAVQAGAGIVPHWSAFHEYGHAAMSMLAAPESCRTLRRPLSPAVSESCAKIAERFFFTREWLATQHVPPSEIEALRTWEQHSELMRVRGILADIEFERHVYDNPNDPHLMDRYAAIEATTGGVEISRAFPAWALKRHLAFEPLARVDYLLARCAQAAVYRRLKALPGGLLGESARRVLRDEVFAGATSLRFEEWFRRATKSEPNCSAWLEDVTARSR